MTRAARRAGIRLAIITITIEIATAGLQEMDPRPGGITKMGKPVRR